MSKGGLDTKFLITFEICFIEGGNKTNEMMLKLEYQIVAGIGTFFIVILVIALIYTLR